MAQLGGDGARWTAAPPPRTYAGRATLPPVRAMRPGRHVRRLAVAAALVLGTALPAAAATGTTPVATWRFNEPRGATVAVDSVGGCNGQIGAEVRTGRVWGTATGYTFPPETAYPDPAHLVTVPDCNALDPGLRPWRWRVRARTDLPMRNIVQKGQTGDWSFWKMDMVGGRLNCKVTSHRDGVTYTATARTTVRVDDDRWHLLTCTRRAHSISATIGHLSDPLQRVKVRVDSYMIANAKPVSIGGKHDCNSKEDGFHLTSCDYFVGDIDWVRVGVP